MWGNLISKTAFRAARVAAPPVVLSLGALYLLAGPATIHGAFRHLFAAGARGVSSASASWELRSVARQADRDRKGYETALARRAEVAARLDSLAAERDSVLQRHSRAGALLDSLLTSHGAGAAANPGAACPASNPGAAGPASRRRLELELQADDLFHHSRRLKAEAAEYDDLIVRLSAGLSELDGRIVAMRRTLAARDRELNRMVDIAAARSALGDTFRLFDEIEAAHRDRSVERTGADLER